MSARRIDDSVKLPATLTGLNLAISIAREATDAVPIVKQTLGAAVRILALAEKIDKDREALHALADRSFQLAQRVKDVMDGRAPDEKILASFERINRAFDSIEAFMRKHTRRTRLLRAIGYVFTVPLHVDRLSRELDDAVQELILVALLDVSHEAHAMREVAAENARYVGEYRLLRHCDVEKLEPVDAIYVRGDEVGARYHRARVDGQLAVVRYFEDSESHTSRIADYECIMSYDRIIMELSTVQRSHRNVARIYGWSRGSGCDRFTIFKAGWQHHHIALAKVPDPMTTSIHWALKVLVETKYSSHLRLSNTSQDAGNHLRFLGIFWAAPLYPYVVDDQLQPTIGLLNDLQLMGLDTDQLFVAKDQVFTATRPLHYYSDEPVSDIQDVPAAQLQKLFAGWPSKWLPNLLDKLKPILRERHMIPRATFSDHQTLSDAVAECLLRVLKAEVFTDAWRGHYWIWPGMLLALDRNRIHPFMNRVKVSYFPGRSWRVDCCQADFIRLYGMDQDSERIVHDVYIFEVPDELKDGFREMFGISGPSEDRYLEARTIATGGPGTYRALEQACTV